MERLVLNGYTETCEQCKGTGKETSQCTCVNFTQISGAYCTSCRHSFHGQGNPCSVNIIATCSHCKGSTTKDVPCEHGYTERHIISCMHGFNQRHD